MTRGCNMRLEFQKVPPLMAIGFINEKDFRILNIDGNEITFESDEAIYDINTFMISIFNLKRSEYDKYEFEGCTVTGLKRNEFSYVYTIKLDLEQNKDFCKYEDI